MSTLICSPKSSYPKFRSSQAVAQRSVAVWAADPRWNRIEWLDDDGIPLGLVTFERRPMAYLPHPQKMSMAAWAAKSLVELLTWLNERFSCRLSTN